MSGHFFRHYLAVFPAVFFGAAVVVDRVWNASGWNRVWARFCSVAIVVVLLLCGAKYLRPQEAHPIEVALPPADLLTEQRYLVNSGFYHPKALIYHYEDKSFIGLPLHADGFDDFVEIYGSNLPILWHVDFSVQDELLDFLIDTGRYAVTDTAVNRHGVRYLLLHSPGPEYSPMVGSRE